jgi:membrane protein implicated in regulation of membrane protease activity
MKYYQISLILAFILVIAEITTTTFIFLGFAFGALVVALLQFMSGDLSISRDIVAFSMSSLIAVITIRKYFKKSTDQDRLESDDVNHY